MEPGSNLLLAGATGLVGGRVVASLLGDRQWSGKILAPVRRMPATDDKRLLAIVASLSDATEDARLQERLRTALSGETLDAYVSCLGTTLKTAGSREAFIAVDRELVLRMARIARELGARQAIVVSSAGASRQSGNFYLRVKGEVEDSLEKMGFDRLDILQPGLLLGARGERRPGEALAQTLSPLFNPLLVGGLRQYRSIDAIDVGSAIAALAGKSGSGQFVHRYDEIKALASG